MRIIPAVLLLDRRWHLDGVGAVAPAIGAAPRSPVASPNLCDGPWHAAAAEAAAKAGPRRQEPRRTPSPPGRPLTPSQSTDFSVNGSDVVRVAPPPTPEQQKADAEARAAWQARCRPTVVADREGLRRTRYAEPDCDLSRFNTAGAQ